MNGTNTRSGSLKRRVEALLYSDDFAHNLQQLSDFPGKQVINYLFGMLCSPKDLLKWRAVQAAGVVVAALADKEMEAARNIMRRFIWNLNDESGGIGWGAPEAMGEIMALHEKLAGEYSCILRSYISKDGNRLENSLLERGALWGLGRLARARPHLLKDSIPDILPYLDSEDPIQRGVAAWALSFLPGHAAREELKALLNDHAELDIFEFGALKRFRVCDLAARALKEG